MLPLQLISLPLLLISLLPYCRHCGYRYCYYHFYLLADTNVIATAAATTTAFWTVNGTYYCWHLLMWLLLSLLLLPLLPPYHCNHRYSYGKHAWLHSYVLGGFGEEFSERSGWVLCTEHAGLAWPNVACCSERNQLEQMNLESLLGWDPWRLVSWECLKLVSQT